IRSSIKKARRSGPPVLSCGERPRITALELSAEGDLTTTATSPSLAPARGLSHVGPPCLYDCCSFARDVFRRTGSRDSRRRPAIRRGSRSYQRTLCELPNLQLQQPFRHDRTAS